MIRVHGGQPPVPDTCCEESPSSLGPAKPCISPPVRVFPGCLGRFTCLLVCFVLCGCLFSRGSRSIGAGSSTESFHFKLVSKGTSAEQPSPAPLLTGWREALSSHGRPSRRGITSGWRASKAAAASGSPHTWQPRLPSSLLSLLSH